ncbi:Hypothetical protein SMAX5B_001338 [Scophthalmus maximus]|uniref:Uncharacterized protein n=1 Tax=Scophthalmus maximus TaxID=52904 RepID=A0A2U9BUD4_SCOMX|nr:Hypothetical protein SMAX5B_001338 [Scophthalmus maximus]
MAGSRYGVKPGRRGDRQKGLQKHTDNACMRGQKAEAFTVAETRQGEFYGSQHL